MSSALDPVTDIVALGKAMVLGEAGGPESNAIEQLEDNQGNDILRQAGVLTPPYDPDTLCQIAENSSALRPNIDAYVINIDSYGHTLVPVIDLLSPDAEQKIAEAMHYEDETEPTADSVAARKKALKREMSDERVMLEAFFENCTYGIQFSGPQGLRGLTRMDLETTGNAYWEVMRNGLGDVAAFQRLPARTVRITTYDKERVETDERRKTSLLGVEEVPISVRFRRYVQMSTVGGQARCVFFKEFGDPRLISADTGKAYSKEKPANEDALQTALAAMKKDEPTAVPATEVIAFKIASARSEYGVPRWIGVLLAVLGTRQAEEVNFMYFDNKSIPPLAVLVSGGRLTEDCTKRLEDYIKNNLKGRKHFHDILILEAESAMATQFSTTSGDADTGRMKITIQPLTEAQQKDGLFLEYDERNMDKVGMAFRLPRLLRGDIRDFNRSTSVAALDFAEVQVFNPERQQFDWVMNRLMLACLSARYHRFVSAAATIRDPEALTAMIEKLTKANVLTPEESRELAAEVFHKTFLKIDAEWTKQPVGITVSGRNQAGAKPGAGAQGQGAGALSTTGASGTQEEVGVSHEKSDVLASAIRKLHDWAIKQEREEFEKREKTVISVPDDIFFGLAERDAPPKS